MQWVDLVVEVVDARLPISSRHPNSQKIFGPKARLLVLTKADLADRSKIDFDAENKQALIVSCKSGADKTKFLKHVLALTKPKKEALKKKGLLSRPMRLCFVGMPNVGKSSLINWLVGQTKTKVANYAGTTRGTQWVRIHPEVELLDTPGILPFVALDSECSMKLALLNLLPEGNYDQELVSEYGIQLLKNLYPQLLQAYIPDCPVDSISLAALAKERHFLAAGGKPNTLRAAQALLTDLRSGKLGRVTLDEISAFS